jgi:biopolymer transport protein ExbD
MAGQAPQETNGIVTGINVTPLVDITLVLLIIFIVTAKIVVTPALPLDLPRAATSEELQVVLSVIVPPSGAVLLNGASVDDDAAFLARARDALARDADVRAVINADGGTAHRRVIHALDLLRQAGIARVAFGTVAEENHAP